MIIRLFFLTFVTFNLIVNAVQLDSLTIAKIEKTIQIEEEIATAFKKYLVDNGKVPTIDNLKLNSKYLPSNFSIINPFGKTTDISTTSDYSITSTIPNNLKVSIYEYYYTDKLRKNSSEPISISSSEVKIVLDAKEKFIFENRANITTNVTEASSGAKYYLEKGALHYYESGVYKYTYNGDLIVDSAVTMLNEDGTFTNTFNTLTSNVRYAGQMILQETDQGVVEDYLGTSTGLIKLDTERNNVGETIIQFTRRAGGMIVNGDIYTWGNNANRITGINKDTYTNAAGTQISSPQDKYPVITTLVRAKVKTDYSYNNNYFSSPLRPKFIDFFSTVYAGTCGVSTEGALYCGNTTGLDKSYGTTYTKTDAVKNGEMLYKSTYFDGVNNKAKKVFSNNQIWHILDEDGHINIWGFDWTGFSGNGEALYNTVDGSVNTEDLEPVKLSTVSGIRFQDISYMLTLGYRKIAGLTVDGDIYIWGMEENNSNWNCDITISGHSFNLCMPTKITVDNSTMTENLIFDSIKGGTESFIAKSGQDYYQIYQPKDASGIVQEIQVKNIKDIITYDAATDGEIISVDQSRKIVGGVLEPMSGIVWINEHNELKGDYFSPDNVTDSLFDKAIKKISWKIIKVIDDNNGMCGIDIYNQMYCWGMMSYYRDHKNESSTNYPIMGNTFVIPVFNTNLYEETKDYMLAEGGLEGTSGTLTNITSGVWSATNNGKAGAFFMKYPTYIGGFNYEFEFK